MTDQTLLRQAARYLEMEMAPGEAKRDILERIDAALASECNKSDTPKPCQGVASSGEAITTEGGNSSAGTAKPSRGRAPLTTALLNEHFLTLGAVLTEDQVRAWTRRDEALIDLCTVLEERCNELAAEGHDSGAGIEAVKAALIAHYQAEGDDTACMVYHRCEDARQLSAAIIHDLDTAWNLTLSAGVDAETAIRRAEKAEGDLESATQPLDEQMARLNARVVELNKAELALRNVRMYAAMHRKEPWAPPLLRFCEDGGVKGSPLRAETPPERLHSVSMENSTGEALPLNLVCSQKDEGYDAILPSHRPAKADCIMNSCKSCGQCCFPANCNPPPSENS